MSTKPTFSDYPAYGFSIKKRQNARPRLESLEPRTLFSAIACLDFPGPIPDGLSKDPILSYPLLTPLNPAIDPIVTPYSFESIFTYVEESDLTAMLDQPPSKPHALVGNITFFESFGVGDYTRHVGRGGYAYNSSDPSDVLKIRLVTTRTFTSDSGLTPVTYGLESTADQATYMIDPDSGAPIPAVAAGHSFRSFIDTTLALFLYDPNRDFVVHDTLTLYAYDTGSQSWVNLATAIDSEPPAREPKVEGRMEMIDPGNWGGIEAFSGFAIDRDHPDADILVKAVFTWAPANLPYQFTIEALSVAGDRVESYDPDTGIGHWGENHHFGWTFNGIHILSIRPGPIHVDLFALDIDTQQWVKVQSKVLPGGYDVINDPPQPPAEISPPQSSRSTFIFEDTAPSRSTSLSSGESFLTKHASLVAPAASSFTSQSFGDPLNYTLTVQLPNSDTRKNLLDIL